MNEANKYLSWQAIYLCSAINYTFGIHTEMNRYLITLRAIGHSKFLATPKVRQFPGESKARCMEREAAEVSKHNTEKTCTFKNG